MGPESSGRIRSEHLQNERTIWLRAPRDPALASHLLILLDGEFQRERIGTPALVEALGHAIADTWVVCVSVESADARWLECPCYPPFARFIVEELLPWLERRHAGIGRVLRRTIAGLSYTGLAAAFVALEFPGTFHWVIAQSGSFWWNDCWLVERFAQLTQPLPTSFYLDVGKKETQEHMQHREGVLQVVSQIEGVRRFRDALLRLKHNVHYVEFDGGHEFQAWKETLPLALKLAISTTRAQTAWLDYKGGRISLKETLDNLLKSTPADDAARQVRSMPLEMFQAMVNHVAPQRIGAAGPEWDEEANWEFCSFEWEVFNFDQEAIRAWRNAYRRKFFFACEERRKLKPD
ncbi:MAG: alpha/beta hydrolase-fold protein [Verrucomicrobiota bacterium]